MQGKGSEDTQRTEQGAQCLPATQISEWKRQLLGGVGDIFGTRRDKESRDEQALQASWYEEIGRRKVGGPTGLKKTLPEVIEVKREWIDRMHPERQVFVGSAHWLACVARACIISRLKRARRICV
ncbi:MAG: hypothetical protein ACRESZ_21905 [Methylococcales bacterium]